MAAKEEDEDEAVAGDENIVRKLSVSMCSRVVVCFIVSAEILLASKRRFVTLPTTTNMYFFIHSVIASKSQYLNVIFQN